MRLDVCLFAIAGWSFLSESSAGFLEEYEDAIELDTTDNQISNTICKCGATDKRRIIGGHNAYENGHPFMVLVLNPLTREPYCGAAILTQNHAITSAHCTLYNGKKRDLTVIAGAHDLGTYNYKWQESNVRGTDIEVHPDYNQTILTLVNDIAILRLQTPLKLNSYVMPICMPPPGLNVEYSRVTILGWGKTREYSPPSRVLQQIEVNVLPYDACKESWGIRFVSAATNPNLICTRRPNTSACMGDSGGPVIWLNPRTNKYTLVGIVSFGDKHCSSKMPTVHSYIPKYLPWIKKVTDGAVCPSVE